MILDSVRLADRHDRALGSRAAVAGHRAWLPVTRLDLHEPGACRAEMAGVDGIRATAAVRAVMADAGLGRTSKAPGAEASGWTTSRGGSGFSIRRDRDPDLINWTVVVSGTPHLRYRRWTEDSGNSGAVHLREPTNPQVLNSGIRGVFEGLGLRVYGVRANAAQIRWDSDDVCYTVTTDEPDWLLSCNVENMPADGGPALVSFSDGRKLKDVLWLTSPVSGLAGYDEGFGGALLTRESVERLVQTPPMTVSQGGDVVPRARRTAMRFEDGVLIANRGGDLLLRAEQFEIENHWGDRIRVWRMPAGVLKRQAEFAPAVPFVLGGELRTEVPALKYDSQFGGVAPWRKDAEARLLEASGMAL